MYQVFCYCWQVKYNSDLNKDTISPKRIMVLCCVANFEKFLGADLDYIHLCKCWSHICSGKVIKKYRNTRFLLQIILFFSSADRKDWNVFGQGMPWLFCKICWMSLHACHAVKTVFPGNIRKFSNIQENL